MLAKIIYLKSVEDVSVGLEVVTLIIKYLFKNHLSALVLIKKQRKFTGIGFATVSSASVAN